MGEDAEEHSALAGSLEALQCRGFAGVSSPQPPHRHPADGLLSGCRGGRPHRGQPGVGVLVRRPAAGRAAPGAGAPGLDAIADQLGEPAALPTGRRLVEQGVIALADLKEALYAQAERTIADVLGWLDGGFVFHPDSTLREAIPPEFELNTARIMLDALRRMDEEAANH
ncbi:MAG: DUF4388 domain-containing protein [bacterium]